MSHTEGRCCILSSGSCWKWSLGWISLGLSPSLINLGSRTCTRSLASDSWHFLTLLCRKTMPDGQSCQEQHLLIFFLCYCAEIQDDWKKKKICMKNVQVAKLHTEEISKVSLWPLLHKNYCSNLITRTHAVFHWTLSWAVAGYSVFLFLSFKEAWFSTFHPSCILKIVLDEPVIFPQSISKVSMMFQRYFSLFKYLRISHVNRENEVQTENDQSWQVPMS